MLSILLDIEWLLSTLFDASLLTFKPPETAAFFCGAQSVPIRSRRIAYVCARARAAPAHPLRSRPEPARYLFAHSLPGGRGISQSIDLARRPSWRWRRVRVVAARKRGRAATMSKSSSWGCWTSGLKRRNAALRPREGRPHNQEQSWLREA